MPPVPVDPGMLTFYEELSRHSPPESAQWPLDRQRRAWDDVCRKFRAPRPNRLMVEDLAANGVHVRVFRPPGNQPKPGVIYFHGGGWVLGSCETHDDVCAEIADRADVVVVLVDYRLAPENPHPAQLEDSHNVLDWMRSAGRAVGID
ncbi:MAG: alpha/beta hydrolase, partial [Pseudomonadota bacterium]